MTTTNPHAVDLSFLDVLPPAVEAPADAAQAAPAVAASSVDQKPIYMRVGDRVMGVIHPSIEGKGARIIEAQGHFDVVAGRHTHDMTVHPSGEPVGGRLANTFAIGGAMLEVEHNMPCEVEIHIPGLRGPYVGTPAAYTGRATGGRAIAVGAREGELQRTTPEGPRHTWSAKELIPDVGAMSAQFYDSRKVHIESPITRYLAATKAGEYPPKHFEKSNPLNADGTVHISNPHIKSTIELIDEDHRRMPPIDLTTWKPTFRLVPPAPVGKQTPEQARLAMEEGLRSSGKDYRIAFKAHVNYGTAGAFADAVPKQ